MSRPSIFSAELGLQICERIADGESLRAVCSDEAMPGRTTVLRWLAENDAFRGQYAQAREVQADLLAEEIIEIADTPLLGVTTKTSKDGIETTEGDMIAHRRLQVDARKWFASKVAPKKYGDRVQTEISGKDGGPIETKEVSDLDAARRIAFMLERAARAPQNKEKP